MQLSKRKALGAYYTPTDLADYLARWAVDRPGMDVLEPAVGAGSLVRAIERQQALLGGGTITGFEIDHATCARFKQAHAASNIVLVNRDFFSSIESLGTRFDTVIANPPFTRNHSLPSTQKTTLRKRFLPSAPSVGAPGLWVYFVLAALRCLRRGGKIGFILPSAAIFADYFKSISFELTSNFPSVELIEIAERVRWEGSAQERAVLLLGSGFGEGRTESITRRHLQLASGTLVSGDRPAYAPVLPHTLLGSLAHVEIGFVTGANHHFLLDAEQVSALGIPSHDLTPAVARSKHVIGCEVRQNDLEHLATAGEKVYLLSPRDIKERGTSLRSHLASIPRSRRKSTAWFTKRSPWWSVQLGAPADAVFTYMNHVGPRLALLGSGISVSNTLHKVRFNSRSRDDMRTACVSFLTTYTQLHAEVLGRVYGGGVLKFELKDARALPLLAPDRSVSVSMFKRIDTALRSGAARRARELADEAIMPSVAGSGWQLLQNEMELELLRRREVRGVRSPN